MRDVQKSRVYKWEDALPSGRLVPFAEIDEYVRKIWAAEGLIGPPLVDKLHTNDRHQGKATRGMVWFQAHGCTERIILHELAHSMTATEHPTKRREACDRHGPLFVGVYMWLMEKHLNIPLALSWYTATRSKVKFEMFAKPWRGKVPA